MKMLRVLFALSLSVSVWAFSASRLAKVQTLSPIVRSMAPTATHYQAKTSRETFRLSAATSSTAVTPASKGSLKETLKVGSFFGLWYALNIGYNIYNKKVLNLVPELVWSVALLQLFVGLFYVLPVWALGIRKAPELSVEEVKGLLPVAVTHLLTHVGAIISLGAGAVSFTHVVKAAEPAGKFESMSLTFSFLPIFNYHCISIFILSVCGDVSRVPQVLSALASVTHPAARDWRRGDGVSNRAVVFLAVLHLRHGVERRLRRSRHRRQEDDERGKEHERIQSVRHHDHSVHAHAPACVAGPRLEESRPGHWSRGGRGPTGRAGHADASQLSLLLRIQRSGFPDTRQGGAGDTRSRQHDQARRHHSHLRHRVRNQNVHPGSYWLWYRYLWSLALFTR